MGGRDVEADLRQKLADGARTFVVLLRRGQLRKSDAAVDGLVRNAFGSPDRLRDAVGLLGEDEQEPRALLTRAMRYAEGLPRRPAAAGMRAWGQLALVVGFLALGVLTLVGGGSSRLWGFGYLAIAAGWGFLARQANGNNL